MQLEYWHNNDSARYLILITNTTLQVKRKGIDSIISPKFKIKEHVEQIVFIEMLNQIFFTNNIVMVNTDLFCDSLCLASLGIIIMHVQVKSSPHYAIQFTTLILQINSMNLGQKV